MATYEEVMEALKNADAIVTAGGPGAEQARQDAVALSEIAQRLKKEKPQGPEAEPTSGFFSDVVGRVGVGQGLAMGYGDELEAYARSAFTDETYEEALKDVREKIATARRERPTETTGAELIGALAPAGVAVGSSLLTGGATTPAAAAAAGRTVGLASNLLRGGTRAAGIGAGQGAIEGFGRGEGGLEQRLEKAQEEAMTGAAFGAGLGTIAEGGRAAYKALTATPESLARRRLLDIYGRDEVSPQEARAAYLEAQASGVKPEIMADIYPGGQIAQETQRIARVAPGANRRAIAEQFAERARGQGQRVQEAFEEAAGTRQGMYSAIDELEAARRADASPAYDRAYATPVSRDDRRTLDSLMLRAPDDVWDEVRREARYEGLSIPDLVQTNRQGRRAIYGDYSIKEVDLFKRGLDRIIERETDNITGKISSEGRKAANIKRAVLQKADEISPDYAAARQAWAGPTAAINAMQDGTRLFSTRSEQIVRDINRMGASEREAFLIGALDAVNQRLGRTTDVQDATRQFLTGNAQDQIRAALTASGKTADEVKEISDALFKGIEREAQMARTRNLMTGGSPTAPLTASEADFRQGMGATSRFIQDIASGRGPLASLVSPVARAGENAALGLRQSRIDRTNEALRQYLMSSDVAGVNRMTQAMIDEASRIGRYAPTRTLVPGLLAGPLRQMYENR